MAKKQKIVKDRLNCTLELINRILVKSKNVTFVLLIFSALVSFSNLLQNMTIGSSRNRLTKNQYLTMIVGKRNFWIREWKRNKFVHLR